MKKVFGNKDYSINFIRYCPICGHKYSDKDFDITDTVFVCQNCNYHNFQSSNQAASVIIPKLGEENLVLINERNIDPSKGLFDLPGGFAFYHESMEETAKREIKEELGIEIEISEILCTLVGDYAFKGKINSVLNVVCVAKPITDLPEVKDKNEIKNCFFYDTKKLKNDKSNFAFGMEHEALLKYRFEFDL